MRYPFIEALTAILCLITATHFGVTWYSIATCGLVCVLISQAMIDFDHKLIPDEITLPVLWLAIFCSGYNLPGFIDIKQAALGACYGYISLWSIAKLFYLLTKKEGMGHGDFKLLAMLGAWGGPYLLPLTILLSSVIGAIIGISLIVIRKHKKDVPIPFGPYLAIAGWVCLLWGEKINTWYLTTIL